MSLFCDRIYSIFLSAVKQLKDHQSPSTPRRNLVRQLSRRSSIGGSSDHSFPVVTPPPWYEVVGEKIRQKYLAAQKYILSSTHASYFKGGLILLQIMFWLINFFYYYNEGFPASFCIAKGFGLNLRVMSIFIYATMARTTMGQLYAIPILRPFIPLGINIEIHSFLGYCIGIHMFGHTFGHIAYQTLYTSGFQNAFTQNSLLRGDNWEEKLKGDGKTGFLLLAFVLVMGGTALFRSFSPKFYQIFNVLHYFYLLYLPMIFLHVPELWPYFLSIAALMILERAYDYYQKTYYTTLIHSRPSHNGVTFFSVPRHGKMTYPGSYYRIKIPSLSVYEWHPFSLAGSTTSHNLTFFIASAGDWSSALYELVKDPQKRQTTLVQVQGPFLAPASQALVRKPGGKILCVASGIGITPFFSVMATKVTTEVSYENDRQLYISLFQEKRFRSKKSMYKSEPTTLLEVLKETRKRKEAIKQFTNQDAERDSERDSNSGMAKKRPSNTVVTASRENSDTSLAMARITGDRNLSGTPVDGSDHEDQHPDLEGGVRIELPEERVTDISIDVSGVAAGYRSIAQVEEEEEEDSSMVKVVWSIRDFKELIFYVDYVHHLVKSQEVLNHQHQSHQLSSRPRPRDSDQTTDNRSGHNPETKLRNAVEVDVYLTGLGNNTDPVFMLSQTLFLLSVANKSSSYMKINFGRPDLEQIVRENNPEEVYFCGGSILKEGLEKVCADKHVPFHPEDFDSGGGGVVKSVLAVFQTIWSTITFATPKESGPGSRSSSQKREK